MEDTLFTIAIVFIRFCLFAMFIIAVLVMKHYIIKLWNTLTRYEPKAREDD